MYHAIGRDLKELVILSYQHGYHAGTFADVVKHFVLLRVIHYMVKKEKPLFYLETHSGAGCYDLHGRQAQKTGESQDGVQLVWQHKDKAPAVFISYFETIKKSNKGNNLTVYPGSPLFAMENLRDNDRLIFCELHPREFERLAQLPKTKKKVFVSHEDGIKGMSAKLPPHEHRGLIFIDPSYEMKTDYTEIPKAIYQAYKRFSMGVYCLWYPLIDAYTHEKFLRGLDSIAAKDSLRMEFYFGEQDEKRRMRGCGLWIINPPYTLAEEVKLGFEFLLTLKERSYYHIKHDS